MKEEKGRVDSDPKAQRNRYIIIERYYSFKYKNNCDFQGLEASMKKTNK